MATPAATGPPLARRARLSSATRPAARARLVAYAFILPLFAIFAAFYLWPALNTIASSLFRWGLLNPWEVTSPGEWNFVGAENYQAVLTSDRFWNGVVNTSIWLVLFPILVTGVSLTVSILIWSLGRGQRAFRTAFLLPMTISLTAAGVIWSLMYNPDFGVLTALFRAVGLDRAMELGPFTFRPGQWLSNPGALDLGFTQVRLANVSLVLPAFWAFTGFGVITFTAGLSSLDQDLVDAARVDGARPLQVVRYILIPALRGPMIIVGVISVIFALRTFDIVWVMTQGGPAQDTEVLAVLLWKQAFAFLDSPQAGLATAMAVILAAVLVLLAFPYLRGLLRTRAR